MGKKREKRWIEKKDMSTLWYKFTLGNCSKRVCREGMYWTQQAITSSKLTIETLEQGVKYPQR